ncbi:MAG: hypothetical protein OEO17_07150 [Gemmatimonadota bacterium]|nr:hypothetical protein [Gemmatimonadota bacterium]MDH3570650.1 hypothetical protein [Gemmatimonadota bacterium]MDH5551434.1 hypothetical protein [Gemmatimonadota bacterium]
MISSDTPRKTFSAPQRYWDLLEEIVQDGHAKNISGALRHVCDEYVRTRQGRELADAARRLDEDEWMDLAGLETPDADSDAPKWSQLLGDEAT